MTPNLWKTGYGCSSCQSTALCNRGWWSGGARRDSSEPRSMLWIRVSTGNMLRVFTQLYPSMQPSLVNISLLYRPNALKCYTLKKAAKYSSAFERVVFFFASPSPFCSSLLISVDMDMNIFWMFYINNTYRVLLISVSGNGKSYASTTGSFWGQLSTQSGSRLI